MKLGVSTYSLSRLIRSGEMSVLDVIVWIAENGGEHVEIVPIGYELEGNDALVQAICQKAAETGLDISNYAIGANFAVDDEDAFHKEIDRVKQHVDIAAALGVKRMRHDVASRPPAEATTAAFMNELGRLAEACRQIADYAASLGIITSVENHGYYIQASERVQALIHTVNHPNFRTTLDIGNFWCADEWPIVGVRRNVGLASMVHLKDFYRRGADRDPGEGWFRSAGGDYLRGAIVGQGDIDMPQIIRAIKQSGYDGYISIEFEGHEEPRFGTKAGLDNARRIWNEV